MPKPAAYDLFVLLDLESPDERRAAVIDQVRNQLQQGGSLKGDVDWGSRKLAYEIDHRGEAQYHLFQFEAESGLLSELDRSLSIDDAVIRHRIIRLPGEAPDTPPKAPVDEPRRYEDRGDRGDRGRGGRGRDDHAPEGDTSASTSTDAGDTGSEQPEAPAAEQAAPAAESAPEPAAAEQTAETPAGDSADQT